MTSMSGGGEQAPGGAYRPGIWFWSAGLLAAMLACLAVSLVQFAQLYAPGWPGTYLVGLSFLTALESILSWRGQGRRRFPNPDWLVYVGAELLAILLVARLAGYLSHRLSGTGADWASASQNFNAYLFNPEYLFVCAVLLAVWVFSRLMASDLAMLQPNPEELALESELQLSEAESRPAARQRLAARILWLGGLMTLVISILHNDKLAGWFYLPVLRAGVFNLLAYFGLGLVLLSLTQYLSLRVGWLREQVSIPPALPARWALYSLVFIGLLALAVSLLPTGYSLGLLQTLGYLIDWVGALVQLLIAILMLPFLLFMALLEWLLGRQGEVSHPPAPLIPPAPPDLTSGPIPWLELLRNVLYWALLLGAVVGAVVYYLRDRRDLLAGARRYPFVAHLLNLWAWLSGGWRHLRRQAAASLSDSVRRIRQRWQARKPVRPGGWLSLRRLSPRQRVLFYYLAMLRRSGEKGYPRQPSQTPYEYSGDLVKNSYIFSAVPERGMILDNADPVQAVEPVDEAPEPAGLEQSIRSLTEQFVEARYSAHLISPHQAGLAQRCWEFIRRSYHRPKPLS